MSARASGPNSDPSRYQEARSDRLRQGTASPDDILAPLTVTTAFIQEFVHVCIDDASRVAFVKVIANQRKESAVTFLEAAVAYYAELEIRIERVMTDNGSCYRSKMFQSACKRLRPSPNLHQALHPEDQRKSRAFHPNRASPMGLRSCLSELRSTISRLCHWLHRYNWHRPHGSLKANTPISRLGLSEDNLLRLHS